MGLKIALAEVRSNETTMAQTLREISDAANNLKTTIQTFNSDDQLTGKAYSSAKEYYQTIYGGIADGLILLCSELQESNLNYIAHFKDTVVQDDTARFDEDELVASISTMQDIVDKQAASVRANTDLTGNRMSGTVGQQNLDIIKLQLANLRTFDAENKTNYDWLDGMLKQINAGIKMTQGKHFDSSTGVFSFDKKKMGWTEKIIEASMKADGWDDEAIDAYRKYVKEQLKGLSGEKRAKKLAEINESRYSIGSVLYEKMFDASKMSSEDKLKMMMNQVNGNIDENGFLQISGKYHLNPNMPPHDKFLQKIRDCMQDVFPGPKTLNDYANGTDGKSLLAKQMHCFRSYIDKNNIEFVRNNFKGKNDLEKLNNYKKKYGKLVNFDYQTGASLHNRYDKDGSYAYTKNMKIQATNESKSSEFIVDMDTGNFVSEWNIYRYNADGTVNSDPSSYSESELYQVANTESFNYGVPQKSSHGLLDVNHPADPDVRHHATSDQWKAPTDYYKKKGTYADIVKEKADYIDWMKVPIENREAEYKKFLKYKKKYDKSNDHGYSWYVNQKG